MAGLMYWVYATVRSQEKKMDKYKSVTSAVGGNRIGVGSGVWAGRVLLRALPLAR